MFSWGKVENDGETTPAPIATAQKEVEAGQANLKIGEIEKALANFRRAIREVEHNVSAKGCEMRLSLHIMIGDLLLRVNKPNQAMEECTSAIAIDGRCVKAILLKARALIADGDMDAASIELNRAQELEPKNGEIADISATLEYCLDNDNNLASCLAFIDAQEYEQAICCLKKIVETAHSLGATRQLAHGCSYLGIVLQRMKGHQDQCVEWHQRHSQLAEGLGDIEERCRALSNLSSSYILTNQARKAVEAQEEQLELIKETRTQKDLCRFYGNMSISYRSVQNFERAVECHQRSLQIAMDEQDAYLQCMSYHQLGKTYRAMEKLEYAANCHREGVKCAKKTKLDAEVCRELHELGCLQLMLGQDKEALRVFQEELAILDKFPDMKLEAANVRANIGLCHASTGEWEEAVECFDAHLQVATEQEDGEGQRQTNTNLEEAYRSMGEQDKALERGVANLRIALTDDNKTAQASAHTSIGRTLTLMGRTSKAADSFRHALSCAREGGEVLQQAAALVGLGLVLLEAGKSQADVAIEALKRGQGVLSELLSDVGALETLRVELLSQVMLCARALQIALLQRASPADLTEALSIAIQAQATDTIIAMGEARVLPWDELEDDLDTSPMTWPELQALAVQTACGVLVYSLLDDHGTLAVWAWTAGQPAPSVRVVEMQSVLGSVAGSWSEMLEKLHDPALAVGEPGGGERWNELMRVLYQVLWSPVEDMVGAWPRLLLAPQGALNLMPWGALLDPLGHPLLLKHAFILEPSLQCVPGVLRSLAEAQATHSPLHSSALVVSNPFLMGSSALPGAQDEANAAADALKKLGKNVAEVKEENATFSTVKEHAKGAGWVHLAVPLGWEAPGVQEGVVRARGGRGWIGLAEGEVEGREVGKGGEKDGGRVTARRVGQEWARGLLGAEVLVSGRRTGGREVREGEGGEGAGADTQEKRPSEEGNTASGGRSKEKEGGGVDVWSWLALVGTLRTVGGASSLAFPLAPCPDAPAADLMRRVYRTVAGGGGLHVSVTSAMREMAAAQKQGPDAASGWEWSWIATIGPRPVADGGKRSK